MAFPVIEQTTSQGFATTGADVTVSLPANAAGQLMVVWLGFLEATTVTLAAPSGWTLLDSGVNSFTGAIGIYKISSGSESSVTISFGGGTAQGAAAITYVISGWGGDAASISKSTFLNSGAGSATVNPPPVTAGWGVDDNLFIAFAGAGDDDATYTGFPTNYTGTLQQQSGAGRNAGTEVASAHRFLAADFDDPSVFSLSEDEAVTSITMAIRPGAALPTTRKGSTFTVDKPGTLGTITTATLNAVDVFDHLTSQDATTATFAGAFTDEITTSGEYALVLGDGTVTETVTVQVNVVGLASFNINKDGADQGSLTDVEFLILTGAAGSRVINQQITGITTTAGGDTGTIEITDTALAVGDTITVAQQSPTVGGGAVHTATLGLI